MNDIDRKLHARAKAAINAHELLHHQMHDVLRLMADARSAKGTPVVLKELSFSLGNFRQELLCHFAWEEHGGYMKSLSEEENEMPNSSVEDVAAIKKRLSEAYLR